MPSEDRLDDDIRELRHKQEEQHREIVHIKELISNLANVQKNTTENINILTSDIKEILKHSLTYEIVEKEMVMLSRRIENLEESRSWTLKLIVGAIIMALVGLVIDYRNVKQG